MIKASSSSTEDGSTAFTRQRSLDSHTNTMVNSSEFSPYLHQSPVSSQLRSVTFLSSSLNDLTCKTSEPLTRDKCEAQKQNITSTSSDVGKNVTALSLEILRQTEILQSLLNNVEDNEIDEIVSLSFLSLSFY